MALPTINDVQLTEPVLTNLLQGYLQSDTRFVATQVFPPLPVENDSGTIPIFTKKYWFVDRLEERAPGQTFEKFGYGISSDTYKTLQYAMAHKIPDEVRANSQMPLDLEQAALQWIAQASLIRKEAQFASVAFGASAWDNSVTGGSNFTKWSDYSGSDPVDDVRTGKRTISQNTGLMPDVLVMGEIVEDRLLNHPDLVDRIKYTERGTADNVRSALAAILGVDDVLVSMAIENTANEGQSATYSVIVDDDALLLATNPAAGPFSPTAGRTLTWAPGGGLGSISNSYYDDDTESDMLNHKEQWVMKVVASDLGYEFTDAVD